MPEDGKQERDAREALERVARDSEVFGASATARTARRLGDHFAGRDAGEPDPIEIWGRRIGRALSLVGVAVLGLWLAAQLGII